MSQPPRRFPGKLVILVGLILLLLLAVGLTQYEQLTTYLLSLLKELKSGR